MIQYNVWLDDIRKAPDGYIWCRSVNNAISFIKGIDCGCVHFDLDHDLGDYAHDGGDAIKFLYFLVENGYNENKDFYFTFRLHTMNPVGRDNMKSIIERYF